MNSVNEIENKLCEELLLAVSNKKTVRGITLSNFLFRNLGGIVSNIVYNSKLQTYEFISVYTQLIPITAPFVYIDLDLGMDEFRIERE